MRENITAKWANQESKNVLNEKIINQINLVLDNIEIAVKNNKISTTVHQSLHELVIEDIKNRGFTLEIHTAYNQLDSDYCTINW